MQLPIIVLYLTILANLLLGTTVIVRSYRRAYGWYFIGIILCVIAWSIGDIVLLTASDDPLVEIGKLLFYVSPMFIPMFVWFFACVFPEGRSLPRSILLLGLLPILIFVPAVAGNIDTFATVALGAGDDLNVVHPHLPEFYFYGLYLSVFFLISFVRQFQKMVKLKGISYFQVAYTFYGIIIASTLALFTNVALPIFGKPDLIWLGPVCTLLGIVSIALAIVRYRLFDIRAAVFRSLAYVFTLVAVSIMYVVLVNFFQTILLQGSTSTRAAQVINIVAALFVAYTFYPLTRVFNKLTARFFYREDYDPQAFIDQLNKVLVNDIQLETLLKETAEVIQQNLKAEYCLFAVKETEFRGQRIIGTAKKNFNAKDVEAVRHITPYLGTKVIVTDELPPDQKTLGKILAKNDIAILARLAPEQNIQGEAFGYLILGLRKSGSPYGTQDIRILDIITKELVIAIQNALHYEEIENFNITLHREIEEATRKLRRTNEKLKRLDEIKDDFISMASHQLRTPLTSVKGYVSMVLEGDAGGLTPMQRKLLNQSFISSQRMAYLISDLLNVSRLRTGKFIIDPVPSNLANVVQDEVAQLQETVKGRNLTLEYHRPKSFPTLMIDETKIRQVIMNFIDNAIYYTPSGGRIIVKLAETPKTIELTVTDNGIGVPKYERHRLFTKFFRAHNAQKARPDGTGLGLFMAKKVIIAQGGAVIFKSQEGKGSTFGFTFPKAALTAPPKPEVEHSRPAPPPLAPQTEHAQSAAQSALKKD